jgi:hypothetical protein
VAGVVVLVAALATGLDGPGPAQAQAPPTGELPPFVQAAQRHAEADPPDVPVPTEGVATAGPSGESAEAGSFTVSPDTGLVHGQTVTIRGSGYPPRAPFEVLECVEGEPVGRACEVLTDATFFDDLPRTGANGRFTVQEEVEVVVDTADGAVDCRIDQCLVSVGFLAPVAFSPEGLGGVPIAFDPAGPDPTRYPVAADPDTGLVDGDRVTVTGDGFPVDDPGFDLARVSLCRAPAGDVREDCDAGEQQWVRVDRNGHVEATVVARAILHLRSGDVDCRVTSCVLLVEPDPFFAPFGRGEPSEAGLVPLAFDPAGPLQPPPVLTADPSTGLRDGDAVTVEGSGFDPDSGIRLAQCPAGATRWRACEGGIFWFGGTSDTGSFRFPVGVKARFRDGFGRVVDCRTTACSIIAGHGDLGRHAEAVLSFDPDAPLLQPTIEVSPSEGLHDHDVVQVTGHHFPSATPIEIFQCAADAENRFECDLDHSVVTGFEDAPGLEVRQLSAEPPTEATDIQADYEVRAEYLPPFGPRVHCVRRPCEIWAIPFGEEQPARAAIAFEAGPAVPPPVAGSPAFTG